MILEEARKLATPGPVIVLGEKAAVDGTTIVCEPTHTHLPIAVFHTVSDMGQPNRSRHAERVANAQLFAHCYNHFDAVVQALEKMVDIVGAYRGGGIPLKITKADYQAALQVLAKVKEISS